MGAVFTGLTPDELCDLMCGRPEEENDNEYNDETLKGDSSISE